MAKYLRKFVTKCRLLSVNYPSSFRNEIRHNYHSVTTSYTIFNVFIGLLRCYLPAMTTHNFHDKRALVRVSGGSDGIDGFNDSMQSRVRANLGIKNADQDYLLKIKCFEITVMSVPQKSLSMEPTIPTILRWLNFCA